MIELEIEELKRRSEAMTNEEKKILIKAIPTEILINELSRRTVKLEKMIKNARGSLRT